MYNNSIETEKEVDLKEIFLSLWYHKSLILIVTFCTIFLGGYYASKLEAKYTASALFSIDLDDANSNISLNSDLGAISSALGMKATANSSVLLQLKEKIASKIFIERIDKDLNLTQDPYFNTFDPHYKPAFWKSSIKKAIGYPKINAQNTDIVWQSVKREYVKNISFIVTKGNNISLSVVHPIPERAAEIANYIIQKIIDDDTKKRIQDNDKQINYLSSKLTDALYEMEATESKLKQFALNNSSTPLQAFSESSTTLEKIKFDYESTIELLDALNALHIILQKNQNTEESYLKLKDKHPIIDRVEFRRILGQSEMITEWDWPNVKSVSIVLKTLSARKIATKNKLDDAQYAAKKLAKDVEAYSALERTANFAEATYTVLLEQAKTNSLIKGFQVETSEVYEYASIPTSITTPKISFILMISGLVGIILGSIMSIIISVRKDVYYSYNALINGNNFRYAFKYYYLYKYRNKSFKKIKAKKTHILRHIREMVVLFNQSNKNIILISNLNSRMKAQYFSKIFSTSIQNKDMTICIINFSQKMQKANNNQGNYNEHFLLLDVYENMTYLQPISHLHPIDFLVKREFNAEIDTLRNSFDILIFSADNLDASTAASALDFQDTFHIGLIRRNSTKRSVLNNIIKHIPLEVVLYD